MMQSSTPREAAVMAAPMRKLCPQYRDWSIPARSSAPRTRFIKRCLVRTCPSANRNRGPGSISLACKKSRTAATGQRSLPVAPTNKSIPLRKGSVFDCFILTRTNDGRRGQSSAKSATLRCTLGSYVPSLGTDNSPALINPKKHKQHAAQMSFVSRSLPVGDHTSFKALRILGVTGRRSRIPLPAAASRLRIPLIMYSSRASRASWKALDRPTFI